jgi:hypothetical protein
VRSDGVIALSAESGGALQKELLLSEGVYIQKQTFKWIIKPTGGKPKTRKIMAFDPKILHQQLQDMWSLSPMSQPSGKVARWPRASQISILIWIC